MSINPLASDLSAYAYGEAYEHFVSAVYLTAIRLGTPTRARLRDADLDDETITVVTNELVTRGLLMVTDDPDTWEVAPPRDALTRHVETVEKRLQMARASAAELDTLWRRAGGQDLPRAPVGLDLLEGVEDIATRIMQLHRSATERLWWAVEASPAGRRVMELAAEDIEVLGVREGVERLLVLDTALLDSEVALRHAESWRAAGHLVRVGNGIPLSVVVSDSAAALVDLTAFDDRGKGSFEVRVDTPVRALTTLFDRIWHLSTPFFSDLEVSGEHGRTPLSPRDQRIVALLATGASDQVIARQTGVSVRTVERRVRHVMDRLGVATRFQAGVQAARHEWT